MFPRRLVILLFFAIFALANAGIALANSTLFKLVYVGRYDEARAYLESMPHLPQEKEWLEGLIAKRQGNVKEAETRFRAALAINPEFDPARRELAHLFAATKNYDGALFHLETLASSAPNEASRQGYEQFMQAIRSKRPYGWSAHFGFLPSTNANKGSGKKKYVTDFGTFTINDESRGQSGLGITAGVSGYYRHELGERTSLLFSGSASGRIYENDELNQGSAEGSIEYGVRTKIGNHYIGLLSSKAVQDWDPSVYRYGVRARGVIRLDKPNRLNYSFSAQKQNYQSGDERDGYLYEGRLIWSHRFDAANAVTVGVNGRRETANREHLAHWDYGVSVGFQKEWQGGYLTNFFASWERHDYDGNFPGTSEPRQDNEYKAGVSVLNSQFAIAGFAPRLTYTYTRQTSNIAFYDYDSHDVDLVFTKQY